MDHKTLVNRFTKACYRFEAIQKDLDILLFDTDDEIKANEYEDLADQAAEIVLKLSANGYNVGEHFYHYYLCRLEYIIAYFRELLDGEETPLAEDKQDELDEEARAYRKFCEFLSTPVEARFEGFPAGCAFPKFPEFFLGKLEIGENWTAKNEENAATDEAGAVEEGDSEDAQPEELSSENQARVRDTLEMWEKMSEITRRNREDDKMWPADYILRRGNPYFVAFSDSIGVANEIVVLAGEIEVRRIICKIIDAIPGFRDSEDFKKLIEQYPTYTFARWGFTGLLVALLAISGFLIFFNLVGAPLFIQVLQKIVGVIGVYLAIFIGKQACFADLFPTSVTRFFAYMREHANTEDE